MRVKKKSRDEKNDVNLTKKIRVHHQISIIASFKKHISTFQSKQYARCFSHEASLVALAPTSLL